MSLYRQFSRCILEDANSAYKHWHTIRNYYLNTYKQYELLPENKLALDKAFKKHIKLIRKYTTHPNIIRFLSDLNLYDECPEHYITNI
jgi:hypothetical protein